MDKYKSLVPIVSVPMEMPLLPDPYIVVTCGRGQNWKIWPGMYKTAEAALQSTQHLSRWYWSTILIYKLELPEEKTK